MVTKLTVVSVFAMSLLPLAAQAQDTYTITFKKALKGSTTVEQRISTKTEKTKIVDKDGKAVKDNPTASVHTEAFQQTILEQPDAKMPPTAIKRTYEKAVIKTNDQTKVLPYQGKTILIEKKDGIYHFRYEGGGEITGDDAKSLDAEFSSKSQGKDEAMKALLFPKKTVKVGEDWNIGIADLTKNLELQEFDWLMDKCKGTGKFTKAYKKDGHQFADVLIKVELPVRAIKTPNGEMPFRPGAAMTIDIKGSICIDGSVEDGNLQLAVQLSGEGAFPSFENAQVRLNFNTYSVQEATTVEILKK